MPSLKKFLEAVDYEVDDGFTFGWDCYGKYAFGIDAGNFRGFGNKEYWTACVIFDLKTQEVYEITHTCHSEGNFLLVDDNQNYRWIHPDYISKVKREAKRRNFRFNQAYDNVDYEDVSEKVIIARIIDNVKRAKNKRKSKCK